MKQRILICDDSPFIRRMLSDWLKEQPDFEVVGVAQNGQQCVELVQELKPDIVTLDVEMPVCDGLSALEQIMKVAPTPVMMVSSVTIKGAEQTLKALELGALDFVTKPNGGASIRFLEAKEELLTKLRGLRSAKLKGDSTPVKRIIAPVQAKSSKIVLIASSTGGPRALTSLFSTLPQGFSAPIVMVQHMPVGFTTSLAKRLSSVGPVEVREAVDGDKPAPGLALLAPGGVHMAFDTSGVLHLTDGPNLHGVKPAADYLFSSAAHFFKANCLGVVLTGMGRDGAQGSVDIRKAGGTVFGEDEASCVVYGMPRAAKEAGGIDAEFGIDQMGQALAASLGSKVKRAS